MGTGIKGDFTGFTFNGVSMADLGVTRISGGDRYNMDLLPNFEDKTVDVPGGDGTYYFGSLYKNREFSFDLAFDSLTETQLRELQALFADRQVHQLIMDEEPHKAYYARISSSPSFSYIPFEEESDSSSLEYIWTSGSGDTISSSTTRIYKGEASINFICYEPFAHSVSKVLDEIESEYESGYEYEWNPDYRSILDEVTRDSYEIDTFSESLYISVIPDGTENPSEEGWYEYDDEESGYELSTDTEVSNSKIYYAEHEGFNVYNPGDVEAFFKLYIPINNTTNKIMINTDYQFGWADIVADENDTYLVYDSKLHLLYGANSSKEKTGTIYNRYIDSGDFFNIPMTATGELLSLYFTESVTGTPEIEYDYLYF